MPHVDIKLFPGRTIEQKNECAKEIAEVISKTLGCNLSSVSINITDIEKEDWKEEVWDKEIAPNMDKLYKKPEYKY